MASDNLLHFLELRFPSLKNEVNSISQSSCENGMHFTSDDVFASQFHSMQLIFRKKLGSAKAFCIFKNLKRLSSEHVLMCLVRTSNECDQAV